MQLHINIHERKKGRRRKIEKTSEREGARLEDPVDRREEPLPSPSYLTMLSHTIPTVPPAKYLQRSR
jgi:hypothetical protein